MGTTKFSAYLINMIYAYHTWDGWDGQATAKDPPLEYPKGRQVLQANIPTVVTVVIF